MLVGQPIGNFLQFILTGRQAVPYLSGVHFQPLGNLLYGLGCFLFVLAGNGEYTVAKTLNQPGKTGRCPTVLLKILL